MIRLKKALQSFLTLVTVAGLFYVLIVAFRPEPQPHSHDHTHHSAHGHHDTGQLQRRLGRNFDNFVPIAAEPARKESQSQRQEKEQPAERRAGGETQEKQISLSNEDASEDIKKQKPSAKKEVSGAHHEVGNSHSLTRVSNSTQKATAAKVDKNLVLSDSERARLRRTRPQKYLVFLCDHRRACGGWGDRQRGLVGTFLLALVTGRRFGLNMSVPCHVANFYRPNQYDWLIPDSELRNKSFIVLDDVNSALKLTGRLLKMDFEAEYPQEVVYIRTNAEFWLGIRVNPRYSGLMPVWARGSRDQYFARGWKTLMAPQPALQERLDSFLQGMDFAHRTQPLVCAHVRVGRSATGIKTDTEVRANVSDLPVLWDFVQPWVRNGSFLFVASDTMEVRYSAKQRFGERMIDSGGEIVHIDQGKQLPNACKGFESALLDQHILSLCDVLITSHSIFSQRAAYIRGRNDDLYSFLKGKINKSSVNG